MTVRDSADIIWSLKTSGLGTNISGAGNSGNWTSDNPSFESVLDLRFIDDIGLFVSAAGITSTPALKVQIDGYDDQGNLFPAIAATASITAAGPAAPVYAGRHGSAGGYVVLPMWGRVSWTCTGGTMTGVEITVIGR